MTVEIFWVAFIWLYSVRFITCVCSNCWAWNLTSNINKQPPLMTVKVDQINGKVAGRQMDYYARWFPPIGMFTQIP